VSVLCDGLWCSLWWSRSSTTGNVNGIGTPFSDLQTVGARQRTIVLNIWCMANNIYHFILDWYDTLPGWCIIQLWSSGCMLSKMSLIPESYLILSDAASLECARNTSPYLAPTPHTVKDDLSFLFCRRSTCSRLLFVHLHHSLAHWLLPGQSSAPRRSAQWQTCDSHRFASLPFLPRAFFQLQPRFLFILAWHIRIATYSRQ